MLFFPNALGIFNRAAELRTMRNQVRHLLVRRIGQIGHIFRNERAPTEEGNQRVRVCAINFAQTGNRVSPAVVAENPVSE